MYQSHEFDTVAGLEDVENTLARATRHPVYVDFGAEYAEGRDMDLANETLDDASRMDKVDQISDLHVIWNNRENERAYMGSERYNLIQHRDVIDAIREAVASTTGDISKGVVRDYGDYVNGVLVFGNTDEALIDVHDLVGDGYMPPEGAGVKDTLGLGMRFHNSFDGRSGFGGSTMGYRFICGNWMVHGEQTIAAKADYHIKREGADPGVPSSYFEDVIAEVFEFRSELEGIVKHSIEEGEIPLEWAPGVLEEAGFGSTYQKQISRKLLDWNESGDTTIWALYNATTEYLDHYKASDIGPERYDHHQSNAWKIITEKPESPSEQVDDLEEFAEVPR